MMSLGQLDASLSPMMHGIRWWGIGVSGGGWYGFCKVQSSYQSFRLPGRVENFTCPHLPPGCKRGGMVFAICKTPAGWRAKGVEFPSPYGIDHRT